MQKQNRVQAQKSLFRKQSRYGQYDCTYKDSRKSTPKKRDVAGLDLELAEISEEFLEDSEADLEFEEEDLV